MPACRSRITRSLWIVGPLALLTTLHGCGCNARPLAPVQGRVFYNGEPLSFGSVSFQPVSGQPATANIQPDGRFTLVTHGEGAGGVVGLNQIRVTCYEGQNPQLASSDAEAPLGELLIPERYTVYETSGLTADIQPGQNQEIVLELTD